MQVRAHLHSLRIAPRKVRLLAALLKGRDAIVARQHLAYLPKRSSQPIAKLISSALANAENNHGMVQENMRIKEIMVDGGPVLKRFEPKGFGSVSPLAKRTSHITIVLEEKVAGLKSDKKVEKKAKAEATPKHDHDHDHKDDKPEVKKELGAKEGAVKKFTKRMFNRKSI